MEEKVLINSTVIEESRRFNQSFTVGHSYLGTIWCNPTSMDQAGRVRPGKYL